MKGGCITGFRLGIVILLMAIIGGAVWYLWPSARRAGPVHGVVLISIDTCRADYLSCYGYSRPTTPNIDAVAAGGVLFSHAIAAAPQTLPSHATMLTGTNPPAHRVRDDSGHLLADSSVTLATLMREHKYRTAAFVSTFVLGPQSGLDRGFETYNAPANLGDGDNGHAESSAEQTTQLAADWLERHASEPFFLFVHYSDPRSPYAPPPPFDKRYADDPYAGEIAYSDAWIGKLIEKLKDFGVYDSTMLIITADHGEAFGEHEEWKHNYFIYQPTIRVPLIIRWPSVREPKQIDSIVGVIDVMPTVLSASRICALWSNR